MNETDDQRVSERSPRFVAVLFAVSGAAGLAYEIIWFKQFSQVWGSSALSLAIVVACFLFGLGLGARLIGGRADRFARPLRAFALCELGIGLFGLLTRWELSRLGAVMAHGYGVLEGAPMLQALVRVAGCLLIMGPPCVLMGATLPILVRAFVAQGDHVGSASAWLYAFNTLGGALGVWVIGFALLPAYGIVWTNGLVVTTNFAIAVVAWCAARTVPPAQPASRIEAAVGRKARRGMGAAALLMGGGSLILQMVWARELSLLLGGSTYAFTALLAIFIAGLGAGSLAFKLLRPDDDALQTMIPLGALLLVASTVAGLMASPALARWVGELRPLRVNGSVNALLCAGTAAVLQGVPTLVMGFLFPALVHLARGASGAAKTVGTIYAWNTAGGVLCALATAPLLLPAVGGRGATTIALAAYLAAVSVLWFGRGLAAQPRALALGALAAVLLAGWSLGWRPDPRLTNLGLYLYGSEAYADPLRDTRLVFFQEGATSNVMVVNERPGDGSAGSLTIRVNGKVDGGSEGDMRMQLGLAWLPQLLRPDARDIFVIGLGTGTTAGASLQFRNTTVECAEIEPAVVAASAAFHDVNFRPQESPRFRLIQGDGRAHLSGSTRRYDLILSEPSNPWIAGIANLYTREFFSLARDHLNSGGMLAQWIDLYSNSPHELGLIVRTARSVFAHTVLLEPQPGDTILLASMLPIIPSREGVDRAQELVDSHPRVKEMLLRHFGMGAVRPLFLAHILLDEQGLTNLLDSIGGSGLNTDLNLRLEFDAPRNLWAETAGFPPEIRFPTIERMTSRWAGDGD